jgi:hypothetical protein
MMRDRSPAVLIGSPLLIGSCIVVLVTLLSTLSGLLLFVLSRLLTISGDLSHWPDGLNG